jgi:hypothetical protein
MDDLRRACATVAARARHVRVVEGAIAGYAAGLELPGAGVKPPGPPPAAGAKPPGSPPADDVERQAAYWLTLDAINFGSGWFPTLRKPPGHTGYSSISAAWRAKCQTRGPWSATQLSELDAAGMAEVFGQDPGHELMALFAESLNDLGRHIREEYGGSFAALADAGRGSAVALARLLGSWPCFTDGSRYDELELPFLKRAQIAVADLARSGAVTFDDLERLTMFADNLVPHVLRLDGILEFERPLVARIEAGELIVHGSEEEVEIRATAVHAGELIVAARSEHGLTGRAMDVDQWLWERGQTRRYKAVPRHRSRSTAY